jgi:pimeloyl-ACP methyl ester carboxylesterase
LNSFFTPSLENDGVRRDVKRFLTSISNRQTIAAAQTFAAFDKPVLIAWGEDDFFFPSSDAERLASAFPQARLERIAGSRTFVQEDQPERLVELLSAFAGAEDALVAKT